MATRAKKTKIIHWTAEDKRTLKRLAKEHNSAASIARQLKRSVSAIYQRASRWGIKINSDG